MHVTPFPGATTALLIGPIPVGTAVDLQSFRAVLWLDHPPGAKPPTLAAGAVLKTVAASPPDLVTREVEIFLRSDARHLPAVMVGEPANLRLQPTVGVVAGLLQEHHRARVTRQRDAFRWQQHLLQNLTAYARRPLPTDWRDVLAGRPAIVCGAGPSLDVSAPRLAEIADRVVILAADSALRTLAKHGVRADFVVSVDVAKEPGLCLAPDSPLPGRAILAPISPPAWNNALPDSATSYLASNQLTTDWLESLGVPKPPVAVTESCGVTALTVARWLGCTPIHLFGLDLALTPGELARRHNAGADAAIYTDSGFNAQQAFPEVPGNHHPTVPTHALGDWRALDARLAGWPVGLVINVNDRGARLRNTTIVHPAHFSLNGPAKKRDWLADLAAPSPASPEMVSAALAQLRACGDACTAALPALQAALAKNGPAGLVPRLRRLLGDADTGRALGGFSLKLMPHLLPPVEGDTAFWSGLLAEFADLARLLNSLR
jgi:hypothetical protein